MLPEDDLQQCWLNLQVKLAERLGKIPDLDEVLLFIGIRESGMPPKKFTETEIFNLKEMAMHTILVPARYYELFWVDDIGWPHYRQLQAVPVMSSAEKEIFLQPFVVLYAKKNKLL